MLMGMKMLARRAISLSAVLLLVVGSRVSPGEDVQLRSRAVALLNQASVVNRFQGGPYNVRTEVSFSATAADGSLQGGSYTRNRGTDGALRQDLRFGDYSSSSISIESMVGKTPGWDDPPYAARVILRLVPFGAGSFDSSDVIEQIKDGSYGGRPAACIEFETIVGENRLPGEICIDKANGTLLELRMGSKLFEYSDFYSVKGGLFPAQIVYRDGAFSLNATLKMTVLEERPEDAFKVPSDWTQGNFCKQFQWPVAKVSPQPHGEGAPDAPVTDVAVHLYVSATGTVSGAEVLRPVRADLDAEAVKQASKWVFEPGTCDGRAQEYVIDVVLHFQGWRVKDAQP
jgi:TonB family protein